MTVGNNALCLTKLFLRQDTFSADILFFSLVSTIFEHDCTFSGDKSETELEIVMKGNMFESNRNPITDYSAVPFSLLIRTKNETKTGCFSTFGLWKFADADSRQALAKTPFRIEIYSLIETQERIFVQRTQIKALGVV